MLMGIDVPEEWKTDRDCPEPGLIYGQDDDWLRFITSKWTSLIIWKLGFAPQRFGELRRCLKGVSAKMLAQRLREMEARGLVRRRMLPAKPPRVEYRITHSGIVLRQILELIDHANPARGRSRADARTGCGSPEGAAR